MTPSRPIKLALRRAHCGATTTEYLMIMVFVVMPIGLLFPMFLKMAVNYTDRVTSLIGLPFP